MSHELTTDSGLQSLLGRISDVYTTGQVRAHQAVNAQITETYWQIGHDIVEFKQGGKFRAECDTALLNWHDHPISTDLLECLNNKIGALQRRAYGDRNDEHLKERLLTLHHTKYTRKG